MQPQLVIGTVHPDVIDAYFVPCLVATLTEDHRRMLPIRGPFLASRAPAGMLHVARNEIVRSCLAHPQSPRYLLFIDTDMSWTPQQVWQLVDTADDHGLPIVGGLAAMPGGERADDTLPVMYDDDFQFVEPTEPVMRVFCSGTAFLLMRRDALERVGVAHGWPCPWFDYGIRRGKAVTEDVLFAQRCWDLDIPWHVDTRIRVGHRKIHPFLYPEPVYPLEAVS